MSELTSEKFVLEQEDYLIIDVRSEDEFDSFCIPNAHNISILDNSEKHEIGKVYRDNPEQAYRMGLDIGGKKLTVIYDQVIALMKESGKNKVLFYCFRGGTRSRSVYQSLMLMKLNCYILEGGIKGYRRYILDNLCSMVNNFDYLVIAGNTGSGKTKYLTRLKKEGHPVIDLEGLANNRGSIFGSVGLGKPTNQKTFEANLFNQLVKYNKMNQTVVMIESEGKKIGNVMLPNCMMDKLNSGRHFLIDSSIEKRIENIKEDYVDESYNNERIETLIKNNSSFIQRLGNEWTETLLNHYRENRIDDFIKLLLVDYYDVLYSYSRKKVKMDDLIQSDDEDILASAIEKQFLLIR